MSCNLSTTNVRRAFSVSLFLSFAMFSGMAQATPYSSLVLSKNPVSYWRLGETSGITAVDLAGSNTGTYVNSPTLGTAGLIIGDTDTAVGFNPASSQIVNAGDDSSLHFGGAITVAAWINASAIPTSGVSAIVGQWDNSASQDRFLFSLRTTGQLGVAIGNGSSGVSASQVGSSVISTGERHFVAFSYVDGAPGTISMYLDGNVNPISSLQSPLPTTINTGGSADFRIGGQVTGGGRYFDGIIDEVVVYDTVLSAGDILELYELGANGPPPVPEPSSFLLLSFGMIAFRRRNRTTGLEA